ncbi:hypothetical protein RF55_6350 [Lasius niger]|uniref:Stringent starvation protein B n=1 Tax=Lasius niger TaxID=67767 RepID=A0A0J7KT80_LASNI|nr:hypothetical protein RF55_6350 [Lasius niger]
MSGNDHNGGDDGIPVDFGQLLNQSLLPYPKWLEEAQREVMVKALEYVAEEGLLGEHHFFISYRTDYPGTILPDWLRARYPENITIVLQRQFGELKISREAGKEHFSVLLSFNGQPTRLTVPFKAIAVFSDPAVPLELQFSVPIAASEYDDDDASGMSNASAETLKAETAEIVQLDRFRKNKNPPPPTTPPSGGASA